MKKLILAFLLVTGTAMSYVKADEAKYINEKVVAKAETAITKKHMHMFLVSKETCKMDFEKDISCMFVGIIPLNTQVVSTGVVKQVCNRNPYVGALIHDMSCQSYREVIWEDSKFKKVYVLMNSIKVQ